MLSTWPQRVTASQRRSPRSDNAASSAARAVTRDRRFGAGNAGRGAGGGAGDGDVEAGCGMRRGVQAAGGGEPDVGAGDSGLGAGGGAGDGDV